MRRVKETIIGVGGATASKLSVRKAKCNKMKFYIKYKYLVKSATPGNTLCLNNTGNYHDTNSSIKLTNVLYEFNNRFTNINY